jgi:ABC-2 type transport system permease protein
MNLQKLLGKNYKWVFFIIYNFKAGIAYLWSDFFWYLSNSFTLIIFLFVWKISNRSDSNEVISYILMGNIFFTLAFNNISWGLAQRIFDGKITNILLVPTSILGYFFAISLGYAFKMMISILFSLLPIFLIFHQNLNFTGNFWIFLFLPIAFLIRYFLSFIIGLSSFWIKNSFGLINLYENVLPVFAGSLIPLSLFPVPYLDKTPPAYLFYHPMQIYLGKYSPLEIFYVFVGGIFWCFILYFLAKLLFRLGLKRNESVGL